MTQENPFAMDFGGNGMKFQAIKLYIVSIYFEPTQKKKYLLDPTSTYANLEFVLIGRVLVNPWCSFHTSLMHGISNREKVFTYLGTAA